MNPRENAELEEALVGCFDSFVVMALDESSIPLMADDAGHMTDRFVSAADVERHAALRLYPVVQKYLMCCFRKYVEEERDFGFGEELVRIDDEVKVEILSNFTFWYGALSLADFMSDEDDSFNPLYLCEYCDGLATMYVQDEKALRQRILTALLEEVFPKSGVKPVDFLRATFEEKQEFYKKNHLSIIAVLQSIGNSLPDTDLVPAS